MACSLLPGNHLKLMIIAKARMSDGFFCYIGWDEDTEDRHKLVRPVLRQNSCRWRLAKDKDLNVGEKHLFEVRSPELQGISHPHRANDVFVSYREPCDQSTKASDVVDLYDILIKQGHQTVKEVFYNTLREGKYVLEHTKCPSVGVYKCKREKLRITTDNNRDERTCEITEDPLVVYKYKITAVDDELSVVDPSEDVLVILGLTRPYRGSSHQFTKLRCYVIVVGFVTRSRSQQQSPQSPLSVLHGENANDVSVSGVLSPQRKRKRETDYDNENKFSSRRFKT